jgi:hypothetical protein
MNEVQEIACNVGMLKIVWAFPVAPELDVSSAACHREFANGKALGKGCNRDEVTLLQVLGGWDFKTI